MGIERLRRDWREKCKNAWKTRVVESQENSKKKKIFQEFIFGKKSKKIDVQWSNSLGQELAWPIPGERKVRIALTREGRRREGEGGIAVARQGGRGGGKARRERGSERARASGNEKRERKREGRCTSRRTGRQEARGAKGAKIQMRRGTRENKGRRRRGGGEESKRMREQGTPSRCHLQTLIFRRLIKVEISWQFVRVFVDRETKTLAVFRIFDKTLFVAFFHYFFVFFSKGKIIFLYFWTHTFLRPATFFFLSVYMYIFILCIYMYLYTYMYI